MSDPTDNGQRNPLSSSSSHASGTSARSISIQQDHKPGAAQASLNDTGASTSQDAGSAQQAREAFPAAETEQHSATAEPEAAEDGPPACEPVADGYNDDAPPAAERRFEQTEPAGSEDGYTEPAAEYDAEPVAENDHVQPAAEHHFPSAPDIEADETEPAVGPYSTAVEDAPDLANQPSMAQTPDFDPAPVDEPAYISNAVADLAAPSAPSRDTPPPNGIYPEATQELRAAVLETIAENEARQETTLALFDQVSRRFTAVLEEAGVDAARVTFKVMEFAQASLKNNLELAQSYAAARSVPDIFGLHAAYMARQFQLLNAQAEELRELTSKIALRNAASLKPQADQDRTAKADDNR